MSEKFNKTKKGKELIEQIMSFHIHEGSRKPELSPIAIQTKQIIIESINSAFKAGEKKGRDESSKENTKMMQKCADLQEELRLVRSQAFEEAKNYLHEKCPSRSNVLKHDWSWKWNDELEDREYALFCKRCYKLLEIEKLKEKRG